MEDRWVGGDVISDGESQVEFVDNLADTGYTTSSIITRYITTATSTLSFWGGKLACSLHINPHIIYE